MSITSKPAYPGVAAVRFPVLERLRVLGYGLYPGPAPERGGLHADLAPGLTVVLGANGLGKTTLVWILYRLLSGPYDIAGLDSGGDLGGRALLPRKLRRQRMRMFASRVTDEAERAVAHLTFRLGPHVISIARHLKDLALVEFVVDGNEQPLDDQNSYQPKIAEMAGLWSFGDWLLLLRHLTFYFEDRRELVWDPSAQRQILRLLFLPALTARQWTETERTILQLDSRVRNLSAALTREEKELAETEQLEDGALDIREELRSLADLQDADEQRLEELDGAMLDLDAARREARLAMLQAEQEREAMFRALEHAKLVALEERFPSAPETARYILAQLLTEAECLACGNQVPEVARLLESRLSESQCVVCGSKLVESDRSVASAQLSEARVIRKAESLTKADTAVAAARSELQETDLRYRETSKELHQLEAAIARRRERIDTLVRRLPKEEAALHEQREELTRLRSRVATLKDELLVRREEFSRFIDGVRASIMARAPLIKSIFEGFAKDFLIEVCELVWSQIKERVGQTGIQIEFPAFELNLASAAFPSKVRRTGPEQVSESQREFIDLSFRMALMAAADQQGTGTLVIDAPESSLDAVFVHRAADVLARFADPDRGNRLIVTSNLTDGELIPRLLAQFRGNWEHRMIDLFEVAEPTLAVRELSSEYQKARDRAFAVLPGYVGSADE